MSRIKGKATTHQTPSETVVVGVNVSEKCGCCHPWKQAYQPAGAQTCPFLSVNRRSSRLVECSPFHRTVRLGLSAARNSAGEHMRSAECG